MEHTIIAQFDTRRRAEVAVEHLVQEYGVDHTDIVVRSMGEANTSGVRAAGADVESGHPGEATRGEPQLAGPIEVCVACRDDREEAVRSGLEKAGATNLRGA